MMEDARYAVVDTATGTVINVVMWDGETEFDPGDGIDLVEIPVDDPVGIGWTYDGALFTAPPVIEPPPPSAGEILAANTATRDALLSAAALAMAPLQDAVELGIATAEEEARLTLWKRFRVGVNRVDLTSLAPDWPDPPGA